jgi:hypothetical protein
MTRRFAAALFFVALGVCARAQSAAPTDAELPAIAACLKTTDKIGPRAAGMALKARADSGDSAARELLAALGSRQAATELGVRLIPLDPDGSLRLRLTELATSLEAARRADVAAANAKNDKVLEPLPSAGGDDDKQGWETAVEPFAGAASAGRFRLPAMGVAGQAEYTRDPWKLELGARALATPGAGGLPLEGDLEADFSRQIFGPRLRAVIGADYHRDDLMGIARDTGFHAGLEGDIVATARQTLTLGLGLGAASEHHLDGQSEHHPITVAELEYDVKLATRLAFQQQFEVEQNPREGTDHEYVSITSLAYKLSKEFSLRLSHEFSGRGQPVPGFAPSRSETTLGLVWRPN